MRINELESQIAFQIKPIVQTQQQTIEFYKTRIQYLNLHGNGKNIENHNSKSLHSHSRTKSLNYSKINKNLDFLSNTDKIKSHQMDFNEKSLIYQDKMKGYVKMLKNTVVNLSYQVRGFKNQQGCKESEHSKKTLKKN